MEKRLSYVQHVEFETPGSILDWSTDREMSVSSCHPYRGEALPALEEFDALLIMGGPMGVRDESKFPWMSDEKKLIEAAIKADKKVIGICLGSQIIADVLGTRVYSNAHKEIGWLPITWSEIALSSPLFQHMPKEQVVFHWHGDTYDLPIEAQLLASSEACLNQAYQYGDNVLAFQCHLEVKPENVRLMVQHFGNENVDAPFIQSEEDIEAEIQRCANMNQMLFQTLDQFFSI